MRGPYRLDLESEQLARKIFEGIGPDKAGLEIMLKKREIHPLFIKDVKTPAANVLKQGMLSLGGEAVVGRWTVEASRDYTDVLLLGTIKQYEGLTGKLAGQPWGLPGLGQRIRELTGSRREKKCVVWKWEKGTCSKSLTIGKKTLVMGILNVTPDSFSDGGMYLDRYKAAEQARLMVKAGADIIDVGGESTRPGAREVAAEEELDRVMPVLELLAQEIEVPLSIDTYKSQVAAEALKCGVQIINDVGGGKKDENMAAVAAEYDAPVIIMHNGRHDEKCLARTAPDWVACVTDELEEGVSRFEKAGLSRDRMVVDPGIGFGKGVYGDLALLQQLGALKTLGLPVLLGVSRKSFLGAMLDVPVEQRLAGSLAAAAWGVMKGADILRVHDVRETVQLVRILDALREAGDNGA